MGSEKCKIGFVSTNEIFSGGNDFSEERQGWIGLALEMVWQFVWVGIKAHTYKAVVAFNRIFIFFQKWHT